MPSCSQELHDIITKYFNKNNDDNVSFDNVCIQFLESHGYTLTKQWFWIKPTPSHNTSQDEFNCLKYLVDEWDFGGIV